MAGGRRSRPLALAALLLIACWCVGGAGARRSSTKPKSSGRTDPGTEGLAAARDLVAGERYEAAEEHIRGQLLLVPERGADELELLHGQALFELQRWGEAVLALRRASAPGASTRRPPPQLAFQRDLSDRLLAVPGSPPTVRQRAVRYLGVARQALTHTAFDSWAHAACQPPLVSPLTAGEGFRRPFPIAPALHKMLQQHSKHNHIPTST